MNNDYYSNSQDYINRWVISYADFVTMLLALFMVMFATSSMGDLKVKDVNKSIQKVFNAQSVTTNTKDTENVKNVETQQDPQSTFDNTGKTILDGNNGILDTETVLQKMKQLENDTELQTSVKVLKTDRGVVIRLNDTMLFDTGSAIIKPQAKATLDKISSSLASFENPVLIEGHTDSMPIRTEKYPSNWELSTARATNIIKYLTQAHKFPPSRLSAVGYGEYMPFEQNTTPQGRAKNRRVDIIVLSSDKK